MQRNITTAKTRQTRKCFANIPHRLHFTDYNCLRGGGGLEVKIGAPLKIKSAVKKGYEEAKDGDYVNLQFPNSDTRRGRVNEECANTIMTTDEGGVVCGYRIRKLTEREDFRLQGVKGEDFDRIKDGQSKSGLVHLAGDSITTTVLMAIFGEMLGVDYMEKIKEVEDDVSDNT
jgi:DNA (cytosine-5)-methyltransferase 1